MDKYITEIKNVFDSLSTDEDHYKLAQLLRFPIPNLIRPYSNSILIESIDDSDDKIILSYTYQTFSTSIVKTRDLKICSITDVYELLKVRYDLKSKD